MRERRRSLKDTAIQRGATSDANESNGEAEVFKTQAAAQAHHLHHL